MVGDRPELAERAPFSRSVLRWLALVIALCVVLGGAYLWLHRGPVEDAKTISRVPLFKDDLPRREIGRLRYLGGLDLPRMGAAFGGISALHWDEESGRLIALSDAGAWFRFRPAERGGLLLGIAHLETGGLRGRDGRLLSGKENGDAESMTRSEAGGWLVGFERDHRILHYERLDGVPRETGLEPEKLLGPLADNKGTEALAGDERALLLCAERAPSADQPNCVWSSKGMGPAAMPLDAPAAIEGEGAVPTDAVLGKDGAAYILFRSYSPTSGNRAALVMIGADGKRRDLAVFAPPVTIDNFEGLALREEAGRRIFYIISDDNFSGSQRTLLMKFELTDAAR